MAQLCSTLLLITLNEINTPKCEGQAAEIFIAIKYADGSPTFPVHGSEEGKDEFIDIHCQSVREHSQTQKHRFQDPQKPTLSYFMVYLTHLLEGIPLGPVKPFSRTMENTNSIDYEFFAYIPVAVGFELMLAVSSSPLSSHPISSHLIPSCSSSPLMAMA